MEGEEEGELFTKVEWMDVIDSFLIYSYQIAKKTRFYGVLRSYYYMNYFGRNLVSVEVALHCSAVHCIVHY